MVIQRRVLITAVRRVMWLTMCARGDYEDGLRKTQLRRTKKTRKPPEKMEFF